MKASEQSKYQPFFHEIHKKADSILEIALLAYFIFGIFLAFFYDTWLVGFGVGTLSLLLYFSTKFLLKKYHTHHYMGSLVLGIFMAQFIYQMHGLFEMHFTALIAIIILMAYQNFKVFLPATLFIVLHHSIFAYIQYLGFTQNNPEYQQIYFTQMDYMDLETFLFHAGLVAAAVVIASIYSIIDHRRSILLFDKLIENEEKDKITTLNVEFAKEIANSNYEVKIDISETNPLSSALINMRDSLKTSAIREKQERFMNKGLAELSNIIRDNSNNLNELTYEIVEFLVKYMNLNQGGFFIVNDEEDEIKLELKGCYAYERRKAIKKTILVGEGLIGQCYLEKDIIYLTEIPDNYVRITSGLGNANPSTIIITPVKRDDLIEGIIELASFRPLENYEIDFLKKAGESIAVAINSAKVNQRTTELYEQSQQQTEEMRAQEEEMRQNMEELSATQEEMQRTQRDYEDIIAQTKKENLLLKKEIQSLQSSNS